MAKRSTSSLRCLFCGKLTPTMVLDRCPRCLSIESSLATDWRVDGALVRQLVRHDCSRLALYVRLEGAASAEPTQDAGPQNVGPWHVHAIETLAGEDRQSICRVTRRRLLPDALSAAETFGRRWLENAPGTTVATYVEKPADAPAS